MKLVGFVFILIACYILDFKENFAVWLIVLGFNLILYTKGGKADE
jgi:hypothetical protein